MTTCRSSRFSAFAKVFLTAVLTLALCLLTACGSSSEISSLLDSNRAAQQSAGSFHVDGDLDMTAALNMGGLSSFVDTGDMSMPVTSTLSVDAGQETAHGTISSEMSLLDQTTSHSSEMYCDLTSSAVYLTEQGTGNWTKVSRDININDIINGLFDLEASVLKDAEFEKTSDSCILTLDAKAMESAIADLGFLSSEDLNGVSFRDFQIQECTIVYTFQKDTSLIDTIELKDVKITTDAAVEQLEMAVDLDLNLNGALHFSQYGQLDPSQYEIPDYVRSAAGE